jgi:hypothetical protein
MIRAHCFLTKKLPEQLAFKVSIIALKSHFYIVYGLDINYSKPLVSDQKAVKYYNCFLHCRQLLCSLPMLSLVQVPKDLTRIISTLLVEERDQHEASFRSDHLEGGSLKQN